MIINNKPDRLKTKRKLFFPFFFTNRRVAKLIVRCFKGVNWDVNRFVNNGNDMLDNKGNTTFYSSKEIDNALRKMNRVLNTLSK